MSELLTINDSLEIEDKEIDVTAFGEVLIDMISREEVPLRQCQNFTRYFGGSPANVLVNLQRLNNTTAFISRVGRDDFGEYLIDILKEENINLDCLQYDDQAATPIIFVNKSKETPSWLPYRGADINIEEKKNIYDKIKQTAIYFIGSFILSQNPARDTALKSIEYALDNNKIIAFDPSFRASLWSDSKKGKKIIKEIISESDFIKPSLDDAFHLFGKNTPKDYLKKYHDNGASIVILTLGKDGVLVSDGKTEPLHIPVFSKKVIDVTGAGDSFWSGFLSGVLRGLKIKEAAKLGNAVAAFKIQGIGALSSIPPLSEIISYYNINLTERGEI